MLSAASAAPPPSAMRPAQLTFVRRRSDGRRPFGSEHRTRSSSAWCRPSCRARSDSRWAARRRHGSRRRRRRRHRCRRGNCFQLHALDQAKAVLTLVETAADKSLQCAVALTTSCSPRHRWRWRQRRRSPPPPPRRCTCTCALLLRRLWGFCFGSYGIFAPLMCHLTAVKLHLENNRRPTGVICHPSR